MNEKEKRWKEGIVGKKEETGCHGNRKRAGIMSEGCGVDRFSE